jgi:hypothetical protein
MGSASRENLDVHVSELSPNRKLSSHKDSDKALLRTSHKVRHPVNADAMK